MYLHFPADRRGVRENVQMFNKAKHALSTQCFCRFQNMNRFQSGRQTFRIKD